jgi:hypothetical protein
MKAALHADVELWEVSAFAELAVWDRRPELQRVLAAVPERGVLTSREIDQALPGLSATASRNVLKHLAYLRLTDDQGALTALGRRCVATGEAPSWELGAYAFLIALNPLFQRQMLGFRRLASDARDLDFNGLQPVPAWFEADPARTWASAFLGDPAFTLFRLTAPQGVGARCRLAELDPARLAWAIDLGTGENSWHVEGVVGGNDQRTTFRTRPESVAVEKVRGMFATWDDRWDAKAARLAMPYDGGAAGGHDTFERTLRYPKVTAGEAGTFLDVQVQGVPVGPNSAAEAQRWALDLVLARAEAAGTFCTLEEWRSNWTAAIGGTPLEARASQCPDPDAATRPDGRPLRPRTRWLLSAARDLAVE